MRKTQLLILAVILAVAFLGMWALSPGQFLTLNNLQSMGSQMGIIGLLSLGMMVTMITGGIDLSIIASANLTGIVTAFVLGAGGGQSIPGGLTLVAVVAGLAAAAMVGLANGVLITTVGVSPILATLGTKILVGGFNVAVTGGSTISGFPPAILFLGNGTVAGVPMAFLLLVVLALVLDVLMRTTPFGFRLIMIGTNAVATRFSGVSNTRVLLGTYMLSALYAGLAGILMISQYNSAQAGYGSSFLLLTILAAVLGGTSATGGAGTVPGLLLALVILQAISSGLNLLGVNTFITIAMWGVIIFLVMVLNFMAASRRQRLKKGRGEGGG